MNKNKTQYSPTDALKNLSGISKNALYDAMNNGDISYKEEPWGKRKRRIIDGAELARYYGEIFKPQNEERSTQLNNFKQPQTRVNDTETILKINILEQQVENLNERLEEVKQQRDSWEKQAQILLIQPPKKDIEKKKGFLARIFS